LAAGEPRPTPGGLPSTVDDLMMACKNKKGVERVIDFLNKEYPRANVYEGDNLDYQGMLFTFGKDGKLLPSFFVSSRYMKTLDLRYQLLCTYSHVRVNVR